MLAFPSMLLSAAIKAGMPVPPDDEKLDEFDFDKNEFPHFWVYCQLQLARPIVWGEHWENAKVIAGMQTEKLKKMRLEDFIKAGLRYQT